MQIVVHFLLNAIGREQLLNILSRHKEKVQNKIWQFPTLYSLSISLTGYSRYRFWRYPCLKAFNNFKTVQPKPTHIAILTLTKETEFGKFDEDDIEEVLACHGQELADEQMMQL